MRRLALLLTLVAAGAFAAPALASPSNDQFAEVRARVAEAAWPRRRGRRRGGGRRPRAGVRTRPHRLSRPLRARGGAAAPARPEPRARPRVQLRRVPQRDPRRRADVRDTSRARPRSAPASLDVDRTLADKGFAAPAARLRVRVRDPLPRGGRGLCSCSRSCSARSARAGPAATGSRSLVGVVAALAATALDVGAGNGRAGDCAGAAGAARGHHRRPRGRGPISSSASGSCRGSTTSTGSNSCARGSHRRSRAGSAAAFAGLGFTAVYREGFETVLFYQALLDLRDGPRAVRRARLRHRRDRACRGRLHRAQARAQADPGEADAHRRRRDAAAALRHVRRQRRSLAAGGRLGLDHTRAVRRGTAADLPRRADRHPSRPGRA